MISLRIFVVENHADTLKWLSIYLEEMGHTVSSARDMETALHAIPESDFDVLMSDIGLPDGDGWELMRRVHLSPDVYAIAMSGFGMIADHIKSTSAGFRRHILKPFDFTALDPLLEEAASEKAARMDSH